MKNITCGVPQGSILGPLLFLLYINDIPLVSNILSSILFADDTTLFCSYKNLQELTAIVSNELGNIMQWLNANKLSLFIDKTNFMLFRPKGKTEICPSIHICGANIIEVDSAKFLGIVIDNRLNWVEHVKCISRKIAKGIGIIIKQEILLNLRHYSICTMHWFFLIFLMVFRCGEQQPLFIYINFMYFRKRSFV